HVMKRAENVTVARGPQVVLKLTRANGGSTVFVVDRSLRLLGYVTADDASKAAKEKLALHDVLTTEIPTLHPDTLLADILEPMAGASVPISVVDASGKLLGIVVRGAVIAALAGDDEVINGNGGEA